MLSEYCYSIYQHTFPNGKIYIGATSQKPQNRWANGKGYSKQPLMREAINEYGWENVQHDILMSGLTKMEAEHFERLLILERGANKKGNGYNRENGGTGPGKCSREVIEAHRIASTGKKHTEETKLLLSEKAKNRSSAFKGHHHTDETRTLLASQHLGMRHTEAAKRKMSVNRTGKNNFMFGKHHSEATITILRELQRKNFKPVKCIELGTVYESRREAANVLNISYNNLKTVCDKPDRTVSGYHFVSA